MWTSPYIIVQSIYYLFLVAIEFIKSLFHQLPSRTRSKALFHRQHVNKVYKGEYSIRSFGPTVLWDTMIPVNLKKITKLADFKNEISGSRIIVPADYARTLFLITIGFVTIFG